jgi:hypothetical protein
MTGADGTFSGTLYYDDENRFSIPAITKGFDNSRVL